MTAWIVMDHVVITTADDNNNNNLAVEVDP